MTAYAYALPDPQEIVDAAIEHINAAVVDAYRTDSAVSDATGDLGMDDQLLIARLVRKEADSNPLFARRLGRILANNVMRETFDDEDNRDLTGWQKDQIRREVMNDLQKGLIL